MKVWCVLYGTILTGLLVAGLVAAMVDGGSLSGQTVVDLRTALLYGVPIQLGIIALFSVLERVLPAAGPRKSFTGYALNLKVVLARMVTAPIFAGVFGAAAAVIGRRLHLGWIDLRFSAGHAIGSLILASLLSLFIVDFFYYWLHRFQHASRLLWQEHKIHHMDEQLCALARESPLEPLLQGAAMVLPLAIIFKLDPVEGAIGSCIGYFIFAWANVFIHTNIRLPIGWAAVLFNGPQVHRIHHSRLPEHFDKNFAAAFPIWDVLFGTYHHPRRDEYPPTGVHDEREVESFMAAVTLPFRAWWLMFCQWRARHASAPPPHCAEK